MSDYNTPPRFRWYHLPLAIVAAPVVLGYLALVTVWPGRAPRFPADYPVGEISAGKRDALQRGWRKAG
jgi:hypothetical protein